MLQARADGMTVAEEQTSDPDVDALVDDIPIQSRDGMYADAEPFALEDYEYPVPGFVNELLTELGKDMAPEDAKLIDRVEPSKDIDDGVLVVYPDESLMFIGCDPTATNETLPWYAFTIEPMEPTPAPQTASGALDLLKPPAVKDVIAEDDWTPDRHGEWWLLPTRKIPLSDTFKPGVAAQPYGPSPLGNHVPREWGFTEPEDEFMTRVRENTPVPDSVATPPEVISWAWRQQKKSPQVRPDGAPSWADIRTWAGEILVKGTIRHRENDHYIEDCGETWHRALTHRMEVYTADALGEGVHLDYYGQ